MSRNRLHISKLGQFKLWLQENGYDTRPGVGFWQVLQVRIGPNWLGVFTRLKMKEHFTVDRRLDSVVTKFIRETYVSIHESLKDLEFRLKEAEQNWHDFETPSTSKELEEKIISIKALIKKKRNLV